MILGNIVFGDCEENKVERVFKFEFVRNILSILFFLVESISSIDFFLVLGYYFFSVG